MLRLHVGVEESRNKTCCHLLPYCFSVVGGGVQISPIAILLLLYRLEVVSLEVNSGIFCLYESRVNSICLVSVSVYFNKSLIHFS